MVDRPAPGATADTLSAEVIEGRGFAVTRRGFDQDEVRGFMATVAGAVRSLHEQLDRLQVDLADAEYRAANPKLDEDTLLRLVGDETGAILRSARAAATDMSAAAERRVQELREAVEAECAQLRELVEREVAEIRSQATAEAESMRASAVAETAALREAAERETTELRTRVESETTALRERVETETTALRQLVESETGDLRRRAESEAARVVDEARQAAGDLRSEAEGLLARATEEAEQAAARIRSTATEEAEQMVSRARAEADAMRQQAEHDRDVVVEGAQTLREKILVDLTRRRRIASTQVEQLRAGRERLLASYALVRRTLEEVNEELHRADEEAREAAASVGQANEEGLEDIEVAPDLLQAVPMPGGAAGPRATAPSTEEDVAAVGSIESRGPVGSAERAEAPAVVGAPEAPTSGAPVAPTSEAPVTEGKGAPDESTEASPDGRVEVASAESAVDSPTKDAEPDSAESPESAEDHGAPTAGQDSAESVEVGKPAEEPPAEESRAEGSVAEESPAEKSPAEGSVDPAESAQEPSVEAARPGPGESAPTAETPAEPAAPKTSKSRRRSSAAPAKKATAAATPAAEPVESGGTAGVDDLFARLRAGREEAVQAARDVLDASRAGGSSVEAPLSGMPVSEASGAETRAAETSGAETSGAEMPADGAAAGPSVAVEEANSGAAGGEVGGQAGAADTSEADTSEADTGEADTGEGSTDEGSKGRRSDLDLEPPRSDEEEAWLQRRDEAVGQIEVALTRKLKRAMQDEQNDLLDRLRSLRGKPTTDNLLPALEEQEGRFSRASAGLVGQGAQAGVAFALGVLADLGKPTAPPGTPPPTDDVDNELAAAVVTPLRHRLEQTIALNADDEQSVLVEALGGAYREWKTQRLERIAGDALAHAFARGVIHATPSAVALRWVVDDVDGPCSDCDDNVLAGALPREEAFPTGQFHPPAHGGCRCIVVPSS